MEGHKQGNFYSVTSSVNRLVWAVMPLLLPFSTKVKEFLVLEFVPPYVFLLNPDYVNNNNK